MIHCEDCGVEEGEANRGDFEECPHGNENCEIGAACTECCLMADVARRY